MYLPVDVFGASMRYFVRLKGVTASIAGYAGGNDEADADYYRVASGTTGHAESVA